MQQEAGTDNQAGPDLDAVSANQGEPPSTEKSAPQPKPSSRRRAGLIATAVAVPVTVVLALVLAPRSSSNPDKPAAQGSSTPTPLRVDEPKKTAITDQNCPKVVNELPVTLAGQASRQVDSLSPLVAAWGDPAIVFRCGVSRPSAFAADAGTLQINEVQWFTEPGKDSTKWTAVDRAVYIEVTVPQKYSSSPIVSLSEQIKRTLPAQPLDPNRK